MFVPFFPFFCAVCLVFVVKSGHLAGIDAFGAFRQEEDPSFFGEMPTTIYCDVHLVFFYI